MKKKAVVHRRKTLHNSNIQIRRFLLITSSIAVIFLIFLRFIFLSQKAEVSLLPTAAQQELIQKEKIFETINQILKRHGINTDNPIVRGNTCTIHIPHKTPVSLICREIATETAPFQAEILNSYEKISDKKAVIVIGHQK